MRKWSALLAIAGVGVGAWGAGGCSLGNQTDSAAPGLILTSPTTDTVAGSVVISADAQDESGIDRVRFSVDNKVLYDDFSAPYETVWQSGPSAGGPHTLKVEATDGTGNTSSITKVVIVTDPKQ